MISSDLGIGGDADSDMDEFDPWEGIDDNLTTETKKDVSWSVRDNLIFLIDCRQNMCVPNNSNNSHQKNTHSFLTASMTFVNEIIRSKCQYDPGSKVGVVLLGSMNSNDKQNIANIWILMDLIEPSIRDWKRINIFTNKEDGLNRLKQEIGGFIPKENGFPFDGGLWASMMMFNQHARSQDKRRIWLLTNDDNPIIKDKNVIRTRINDAILAKTQLTLWPFESIHQTEKFDITKFWQFILLADIINETSEAYISSYGSKKIIRLLSEREEDDASNDFVDESKSTTENINLKNNNWRFGMYVVPSSGDISDPVFMAEINKRTFPRRVAARVCFDLLPNISISLGVYNIIAKKQVPQPVKIHQESGSIVYVCL